MKYALNTITVALENYRHYWRGIPKIGKTTMFRDLVLELYGSPEYGLLISPGNETGFKAISNLYAVEAPTWEEFTDIVDDLVENKEENKFKLVAIDTVDELISIASDKTLKVHYQRKNEKCQTLNSALGGYGAGHKYVCDLINDQIRRLEGANYGLVFLSHTKIRDIKEKNMEEGYQTLTTNLESRFDRIFSDKSDIIATFFAQKEVKDKELVGTERFIYFRSDGFVDAGSRFANMPERVPMTAKEYIKAFEQGVKNSFSANVTIEDIEKIKKNEIAEKEKKAAEFIEKVKSDSTEEEEGLKTVEDYRNAITEKLSKLDKEVQKQKQAEIKAKNIPTSYKTIEDIEVLKKFLKIISKEL
jgi:hypothetical protein